jgi:multidrug transporter EmrE-like cation transporter
MVGMLWFHEPTNIVRLLLIVLIVAAIGLLRLSS